MKTRTTKKAIMTSYRNVIKVGYCDLQQALKGLEPNYYTAGVYGWNADIYVIDNDTVLVTGYRPFGNTSLTRDTIETLNKCGADLMHYRGYTAARQAIKENLRELSAVIEFDLHSYIFAKSDGMIEIPR